MISPQMQHLKNLLEQLPKGDPSVIRVVRNIFCGAVESAPLHHLITIGETIFQVGLDSRIEQEMEEVNSDTGEKL